MRISCPLHLLGACGFARWVVPGHIQSWSSSSWEPVSKALPCCRYAAECRLTCLLGIAQRPTHRRASQSQWRQQHRRRRCIWDDEPVVFSLCRLKCSVATPCRESSRCCRKVTQRSEFSEETNSREMMAYFPHATHKVHQMQVRERWNRPADPPCSGGLGNWPTRGFETWKQTG